TEITSSTERMKHYDALASRPYAIEPMGLTFGREAELQITVDAMYANRTIKAAGINAAPTALRGSAFSMADRRVSAPIPALDQRYFAALDATTSATIADALAWNALPLTGGPIFIINQ